MSLLELLGESYDPGNIGSVTSRDEWRPTRSRPAIIARGVVALSLVGGVLAAVFWNHPFTWTALGWSGGLLVAYLLAAYFVRPKPDLENIGWLGGLIDNPFRYSDDVNRFLMFLMIVLLPGRFVADSLVDLVRRPRPTAS